MYRLNYHYYKRKASDRTQPEGQPIYKSVVSDTLKGINKAYEEARFQHDCFAFTICTFDSIEEVKR